MVNKLKWLAILIIFLAGSQVLAADPDVRYVYNTEVLNVRAQPSTNTAVIGYLLYGDTVEVIGQNGVWLWVKADILANPADTTRTTTIAWVHEYYITEKLPWLTEYHDNEIWRYDCSLTCESFTTLREAMFNFLEGGCYTNVTINNNGFPVPCDNKFDTSQYVPLRMTIHRDVIYGN